MQINGNVKNYHQKHDNSEISVLTHNSANKRYLFTAEKNEIHKYFLSLALL